MFKTPLEKGCYKWIEETAEGYEQPDDKDDEQQQDNEDDDWLPGSLVHLSDDNLIAIHILDVRTMEEVNDITNIEWYHAHQHITQCIINNGQRQGDALDDVQREIDERQHTHQRNDIAPSGYDADNRIQKIAIHIFRQHSHRLIDLIVHQASSSLLAYFFLHF